MAAEQPIGVKIWNQFILFLVKRLPEPWLSKQARKPSGLFGRWFMTRMFKNGNAELNFFILQLLKVQKTDHVLEIGFGPGFLLSRLAQSAQEGQVDGLDFSVDMYNQAFFYNRGLIRLGVIKLSLGNSSDMPYQSEQFDKVCTANTLYFWQPPEVHLAEIHRVLKPGGQLVLGFRDKEQMDKMPLDDNIFSKYSQVEVAELLTKAGFHSVEIVKKPGAVFESICAVAYKQ